jgi:tricorn protease-like protein
MLRVHRQYIVLRYTASHADSRKRAEILYRVAFEGADLIKMSLVTAAAMLAICVLALVQTTNKAEAEDSLPQNGKIAFTFFHFQDQDYAIYTVDPDSSSLRQLTNNVKPDDHPAWSPDGTKIAFGYDGPIWVMGADGSRLRKLTSHKLEVSGPGPSWLPDGTTLAFGIDSHRNVFGNDLYTMDVDGSNKTRIANSPKIYESSSIFHLTARRCALTVPA